MPSATKTLKDVKKSKKSTSKKLAKEVPAQTKSAERIADSDLEDDEDGSDKSDDAAPQKTPQIVAPPRKSSAKVPQRKESQKSSEESDDSESAGEESEESDEDVALPTRVVTPALISTPSSSSKTPRNSSAPPRRPPPRFEPPAGYESLSADKDGKSQASQLFSPTNVKGKQIWYFTAPASVPISAVKKVSLQEIQIGKASLSHGGQDYGFVRSTAASKTRDSILIPDDRGKSYQFGQISISQTFHLQQMMQIPNDDARSISAIPPRLVRKQPDGLKMRFCPIGFGAGRPGTIGSDGEMDDGSDDDMADSRTPFRAPPVVSVMSEDESMVDAPVRKTKHKSKKRKVVS